MQRHQIRGIGVTRRAVIETAGEAERRQAIARLRQVIEHGDRSGKLTTAMAKKLAAAVEAEMEHLEWVG